MKVSTIFSVVFLSATHCFAVVNGAALTPVEVNNATTTALEARDDGFKYSCPQIWFNSQFRSLLFAQCYKADGTMGGNTQINLDRCVANQCGELVARPNGGLWGSCDQQSCSVWNAILKCNCKDCNSEWQSSILDLNWFMGNNNRMLTCHGLSGI